MSAGDRAVIEDLVPAGVMTVEAFGDLPDIRLYPEEEQIISRAVARRRAEFTTGRGCARRALARLGIPAGPILRQANGAPRWPDGIAGSITHCAGYRAAAVARTSAAASVGIDAEPDAPLPPGVLALIATPGERAWVAEASSEPGVCWDRLLFSIKESVYKAWFPLTGDWLSFTDAEVEAPEDGEFTARLLVPGPVLAGQALTGFSGRWLSRGGLVVTAVTVDPAG
ncbi:MAG: 4'-phosphopantetheinyl transferase family protein [Streptosporangiaceae bacterium]